MATSQSHESCAASHERRWHQWIVAFTLIRSVAPLQSQFVSTVRRGQPLFASSPESPFRFADVVAVEPTEPSTRVADWVQPSVSRQLALIDKQLNSTEAAIEAATSRAVEARLETASLKAKTASFRQKSATTTDIANRAKNEAEELKASAGAAKRQASALIRSRNADVAEAVRVVKTDLATARLEASQALEALAAAKLSQVERLQIAREDADKAVADLTAQVVADTGLELRVKPASAVATAAISGLLCSKAAQLDQLDLIFSATAAGLMLAAISSE